MRTGTCHEHAQRPKHDIKPNSVKKNRQRRQEKGIEPAGQGVEVRKTNCAEQCQVHWLHRAAATGKLAVLNSHWQIG